MFVIKSIKVPDDSKEILTDWINGYSNNETYNWTVQYGGRIIGNLALSGYDEKTTCHHLGWQINSSYWNKGIMTEAYYQSHLQF